MSNGTLTSPNRTQYLVSKENKKLLGVVDSFRNKGRNTNILVTGKSGCGKSALSEQYAASRELPFAMIECGGVSEATQFFGRVNLLGNETVWEPGLFTKAIQTPNCVVHLQEINRPESDKALNALFSVLDDSQRKVWIDEAGGYISVARGVTFFASLNEGFEFIGTMPLDSALRNRFIINVKLGYLPARQEANLLVMKGLLEPDASAQLIEMVGRLRSNSQHPIHISTRDVLAIAELRHEGLDGFLSIQTVIGHEDDQMEAILVSQHFSGDETTITNEDADTYEPI